MVPQLEWLSWDNDSVLSYEVFHSLFDNNLLKKLLVSEQEQTVRVTL